jgi:hypothetical protein
MGGPNPFDQLVLLALKALRFGFGIDHLHEKVADLRGNGAVFFGRSDPGAVVELVSHRYCDVFHSFSVTLTGWGRPADLRANIGR